jgi:hypothetical protein
MLKGQVFCGEKITVAAFAKAEWDVDVKAGGLDPGCWMLDAGCWFLDGLPEDAVFSVFILTLIFHDKSAVNVVALACIRCYAFEQNQTFQPNQGALLS